MNNMKSFARCTMPLTVKMHLHILLKRSFTHKVANEKEVARDFSFIRMFKRLDYQKKKIKVYLLDVWMEAFLRSVIRNGRF